MHLKRITYGFLTTYKQTIFLKQTPHPKRAGRWVLWYSPVITHDTESKHIEGDLDDIQSYRRKVSLRECLLYLTKNASSGDYESDNQMRPEQWYGGHYRRKDDDSDTISDGPGIDSQESSECENPRPANQRTAGQRAAGQRGAGQRPSQPTSRASSNSPSRATDRPSTRSQTRQMELRGGRLNQANTSSQHPSTSAATVYFDDRTGQWFLPDRAGRPVFIELREHTSENGGRMYYYIENSARRYVVPKMGESRK